MIVMLVVVPPMNFLNVSSIPIAATFVISMNPALTLEVTRHPHPMPAVVPESRTVFVIRPVADANLKVDSIRARIEDRARTNQHRQ